MVLIVENRKKCTEQGRKKEHEQKGRKRTESKVVTDGGQQKCVTNLTKEVVESTTLKLQALHRK